MSQSYTEKISNLMLTTGNRLSLGIDPPHGLESLQDAPFFAAEWKKDAIGFLNNFCAVALEAAQGRVASVKFQSAFFEALGPEGFAILKPRMAQATASGLSVILDVKRGDISSTMTAYGKAAFDQLGADAMTINTYMGADVLQAILPWLQKGRGAYLVWMTSNPAARAIQSAQLATGETVSDLIFHAAQAFSRQHDIDGALGFVLGTTRFDELSAPQADRLLEYSILLPGMGPQGGEASASIKAFVARCPAAVLPMSRSLTGIGDPQQAERVGAVRSWDEYGDYIGNRISVAATDLTC